MEYCDHDELASEFDGVSETLRKLKDAGFKMAIVSTKRNDMVMKGLDFLMWKVFLMSSSEWMM